MNVEDAAAIKVFVDDGKVTPLRPHQRRQFDDDDTPGVA